VSTPSLGPDDVRAAAEVHAELGPDYRDAVLQSFLERVNKEIDTRVDQRLAAAQQPEPPAPAPPAPQPLSPGSRQLSAWLPIVSIALGIPITAIIFKMGQVSSQTTELVWVWIAIAVINVAYVLGHRRPPSRG
jgi:hypothetical protein